MRLLLLGYFDGGRSIGVDDRAFGQRRLAPHWPSGMDVALGRGVSIALPASIAETWKADAAQRARDDRDEAVGALAPVLDAAVIKRCDLRVFSLGVALVSFELSVPPGRERDAIRLAMILEFASYHGASKSPEDGRQDGRFTSYGEMAAKSEYTGIVTQLQEWATRELDLGERQQKRFNRFSVTMLASEPETEGEMLAKLTERTPTYSSRDDGTANRALPGYMYVLVEENGDDQGAMCEAARDWEGPRGHTRLEMDDDSFVWLGWATAVVSPRTFDGEARVVSLLELCQLFHGLTESLETVLTRRFLGAARRSFESASTEPPLKWHSLYRLRMLALALIGVTSFKATTNNISDWSLLEAFDSRADIAGRHERIAHAAQVFGDVEGELIREQEESRGQKVKQVLAFITFLGIIGVVADVIGVVDVPEAPMSLNPGRAGLVIMSGIVALAIFAWILLTKGRL